jgi:hypothetical protein
MARERSALVTTVAIMHLIGGGLGLITTFCGGGWLLMMATVPPGPGRPSGGPEPQDVHAYLKATAPGYMGFQVGTVLLGLILSVLLLSAGIGLLNRQAWARWASIVWAVLSILTKLGSALYLFLVIHPAMTAQVASYSRRGDPAGDAGEVIGMMSVFFGDPCTGLPFIIYPIGVLIVLLLPGVAASFDDADDRDRGWRRRPRDDDEDDEDEEDRGRRRRRFRDDD